MSGEPAPGPVELLSAVTLASPDMAAAVGFYEALGFVRLYGGPEADFTSFGVGSGFLNLVRAPKPDGIWGRVVLWVDDVDAMHARAVAAGFTPATAPADAPWGERYFHLHDPSGHELSFARPLSGR